MDLVNSTKKINCRFASSIHEDFLSKRFGINSCVKHLDFYGLLKLHHTKSLLDHYIQNSSQYELDQLTTNLTGCADDPNRAVVDGPCDISKLIEKINLL